jgi:hypothetical protein
VSMPMGLQMGCALHARSISGARRCRKALILPSRSGADQAASVSTRIQLGSLLPRVRRKVHRS